MAESSDEERGEPRSGKEGDEEPAGAKREQADLREDCRDRLESRHAEDVPRSRSRGPALSAPLRVAVLTVSDRSFRGEREDRGGPAVAEAARRLLGAEVVETQVVSDEKDDIVWHLTRFADNVLVDVVLTTGGTGISERDVTPEATRSVISLELPGLPEAMRAASRAALPSAMLSRQVGGIRGKTLVVNLPGSPRGAVECLEAIAAALPHAVAMLRGEGAEAHPTPLRA